MKKERNSSVELLRILSILFIICSHLCVHSGIDTKSMDFSFNKLILQFGVLGNLGVDIFVMISGYFLSQSTFKLSRIVRIWLQVLFYSVFIYFALVFLNLIPFSIKNAIKACLPILFRQYWFATAYIVFCILSPFLNFLLDRFSKAQFLLFMGTLFIMWSVIPTFFASPLESNELCQFLLLYTIGAYVRKYPNNPTRKFTNAIIGLSSLFMIMSTVAFNLLAIYHPAFNHGTYFYARNSVLVIALSYGLLLTFVNIKIGSSRFINAVSSTTFGIYLIHDNGYIRPILWKDILHVKQFQDSPHLIFYLCFCIAAVFIACGILDYIRQKLIEKPVMTAIDPVLKKISEKFQEKASQIAQ